jgi:hypothetical protein
MLTIYKYNSWNFAKGNSVTDCIHGATSSSPKGGNAQMEGTKSKYFPYCSRKKIQVSTAERLHGEYCDRL